MSTYFFYSFNIEEFHIQSIGHRTWSEDDVDALDLLYNPSTDIFTEWYNQILEKEKLVEHRQDC